MNAERFECEFRKAECGVVASLRDGLSIKKATPQVLVNSALNSRRCFLHEA